MYKRQVPWPLNIAAAAAAGAAGFAQVANIRNTNKGGGGGGGSAAASAAPAAAAPVQQQSLFVSGLSADTIVSGLDVRRLLERVEEFRADGGKVVFA